MVSSQDGDMRVIDLNKVERWDFLEREDDSRGWYREADGEWVRFSDLQSLVTPGQWIAVSERLPEYNVPVLMTDGVEVERGVRTREWSYREDDWFPDDFEMDFMGTGPVTHWQPLPPPPKDTQ